MMIYCKFDYEAYYAAGCCAVVYFPNDKPINHPSVCIWIVPGTAGED